MLLEHESVYTAGKRTAPHERPTDGTPVVDVDRGGKITWHGPGQLVGYPILRLAEPIDVVGYVRRLEGMLIAVLDDVGVTGAERVPGRSDAGVTSVSRELGRTVTPAEAAVAVRARFEEHVYAHVASSASTPESHPTPSGVLA